MRASIIIPTFNAAQTLPETLDSVICQISDEDEVLIVDDGSTDETSSVIAPYLQHNIRYFYQKNSGGPASPRNRGIAEARGEFIFMFDSDDLMLPGKIEATLDAFAAFPDAAMIFTNFRTIDASGQLLTSRFLDSYSLPRQLQGNLLSASYIIDVPVAYREMARENYIGTSGVTIRRSVLNDIGGFDETLRNSDDRDMWFRITRRYSVVYLPGEYHCYRIRSNSISKQSARKRTSSKLKVLERQLESPLDARFKRDIRKLIAANYMVLAYEEFVGGNLSSARSLATLARRNSFSWASLKLFGKTLLGVRTVKLLKRLKAGNRF